MTMTQERFQQLTDSYGAEPKRWPAAERAAAQAFAEAQPEQARAALFAARMIDAALDMSPAIEVRPALRNAILATAPKPRPRRKGAWFWIPGAGLAAACAAGALAGVAVMRGPSNDAHADMVLASAADSGWTDAEMTEPL
jgi:hypothetical protein